MAVLVVAPAAVQFVGRIRVGPYIGVAGAMTGRHALESGDEHNKRHDSRQ